MTYNTLTFIETNHFTNLISKYLKDDEYLELQLFLMEHPDLGDIIRESGGIRKLRWSRQGMGKSSGLRIIYYWAKTYDQIYMITLYSKAEKTNIDKFTLDRIAKTLENMR